jgi:PST family polysaccharide transporter
VSGKSRLKENIVSLLVLQGANYLLPLIIVPYLLRVLGPANFGRMAFAQAFVQYFVVLTDYGFNLTGTRAVVEVRDDSVALSRLASAIMGAKLLLMGAGFAVMVVSLSAFSAERRDYVLFALAYLAVVGNVLFPVWLFQGLQRMREITMLTIASRVTVTVSAFLFVKTPADFRLAAALQASGFVIAGVLSLFMVRRVFAIRFGMPSFSEIRKVVADGWHVFVATIGGSLYSSSNVFILGLLVPAVQVGYFAAAERLIRALQTAITPISQAVYPHVSKLLVQSRTAAIAFLRKLLRLQGVATLAISCGLLILADPVGTLLFGHGYEESVHLLRIMAVIPFIVSLNNVLGAQVLVQFKLGRLLSLSIILPALLHLCLLYFVVRYVGNSGVAFLAVFTEVAILTLRVGGLARWHPELFSGVVGITR